MKQKKTYTEMVRPISLLGAIICSVFIGIEIVIITANVFMRYVFNSPIQGTTELVALLMPYIAYFAIGYTAMINGHIQMTAICDKFKGRHKYISKFIINTLGMVVFILLVYVAAKNFMTSLGKNEIYTATITLYAWVGKFAVLGGSAIMLIQLIAQELDAAVAIIKYKPETHDVTAEG